MVDFEVRNTALKQPGLSFMTTLNQTMRSWEHAETLRDSSWFNSDSGNFEKAWKQILKIIFNQTSLLDSDFLFNNEFEKWNLNEMNLQIKVKRPKTIEKYLQAVIKVKSYHLYKSTL